MKDPREFYSRFNTGIEEVRARLPFGQAVGTEIDYESSFRVGLGYLLKSAATSG